MPNQYDTVVQLTSAQLPDADRLRMLNDFAYELGWQPSDRLVDAFRVKDLANAHLVVEHGLENTAVITFLQRPRGFSDLNYDERKRLLTISYNNLVDWHIQVGTDEVSFVFNRIDPPKIVEKYRISRDNFDKLRSEAFEQVTGKRPNPNILALDDALIETISIWRRSLSVEMDYAVPIESLSALFNAIILVRAAEDYYRRFQPQYISRTLLEAWREQDALTLRELLVEVLERFSYGDIPEYLVNEDQLGIFDKLDRHTVFSLLSDFYQSKYAPYEYDFSLISKHALSRIYERYVSILHLEESGQPTLPLFGPLPEERWNKAYGSVYTPQFIARFFVKYLREQMPPVTFKRIRSADPACGSGIFLRTILELQCDPAYDVVTTEFIQDAFDRVLGIDIDENAAQAARLSLALLYLVLTRHFPGRLSIFSDESIRHYQEHSELEGAFDVVIANPPFVSLDDQSEAMRERVAEFMDNYATGRIDMYLAFLRIGLEMLKPGGYGLFVLPHSFLLGGNAKKMRKLVSEESWIRCLADLSAIRVFQDTSSYVVLLIFQKKSDIERQAPSATIVKCQDLVGRALQDAVEGRRTETNFYSIYEVEQDIFTEEEWIVLPPTESAIERKFNVLPTLDDFLWVRQGFVSGADDVFILSQDQVAGVEDELFVPFLQDREMQPYKVPQRTEHYFFYPYIDGHVIEEQELKEAFPQTWAYLLSHQEKLKSRSPVRRGNLPWWRPVRPRPPERMMRSKIVTPHLVLVPRFSLDKEGKYSVSRAPILYPKKTGAEEDLLRFFLAVLNSTPCYWYISTHSHTYRSGYVMLEVKTLRRTPVPDPAQISPAIRRRLLHLVDRRLAINGSDALEIEKQIDELVAELYKLTPNERLALGMED